MGMIEDVMKALDRIPLWKRVSALPAEMQALRERLELVEAKLAGKTGPLCPLCNAPGFAITASAPHPVFGDMGVMQDTHHCQACGHSEQRRRDPSG